jgi:hypothetical protein
MSVFVNILGGFLHSITGTFTKPNKYRNRGDRGFDLRRMDSRRVV